MEANHMRNVEANKKAQSRKNDPRKFTSLTHSHELHAQLIYTFYHANNVIIYFSNYKRSDKANRSKGLSWWYVIKKELFSQIQALDSALKNHNSQKKKNLPHFKKMSFLNGSIENYCSATGSQKEYIGRTTASFSSKDKQENVMYKVFKSMIQNL